MRREEGRRLAGWRLLLPRGRGSTSSPTPSALHPWGIELCKKYRPKVLLMNESFTAYRSQLQLVVTMVMLHHLVLAARGVGLFAAAAVVVAMVAWVEAGQTCP